MQINNWNEARKLQNEINTYLKRKLYNLKDNRTRLVEIKTIREQKAEKSAYALDTGIQNVDTATFVEIIYLVVVERYFTSTKERNESSITKYYAGKREAPINKLEQRYVNKIEEMKQEESRLNTLSENAEFILWTMGFLVDNRDTFSSMINQDYQSQFKGELPKIISNEANGQKALKGILRRNELANPSLVVKLDEIIEINQQLITDIEHYIN